MAFWVYWIEEGPDNSHVEQGGRVVSRYKRKYLYRTDSATSPTAAQIVSDIGIYPGSPHPDDSNATCQAVTISHGVGPTKPPHCARHVEVEWATNAPLPNNTSTDPTTQRTRWTIKPTIQSRYIVRDRLGTMILNAAGQPFDGGVPVAVRLGVAVAKKCRTASGYNLGNVMARSGSLNTDTYLGAVPGTLQVDMEAEEQYQGGYHYWDETYTFAYDPQGWQPKPMNAGFFYLDDDGNLQRILNSDIGDSADPDSPVQEPEPLMPDGSLVPVASRPASCNFIEVDYYPFDTFSSYGL